MYHSEMMARPNILSTNYRRTTNTDGLTPATPAGMHDVLQGKRLASRKMRVKSLQVAADLAASYSGYTPESGTRAREDGEGSEGTVGHEQRHGRR
ncbi:MAG: hypothetical protein QOI57_155 [Rubrobacteraceae bacterium]|jgi:hypothetical protein|nr:hypothetical protein [Rubrobacteraceae bacterium]